MLGTKTKQQILQGAGYAYNFDRGLYFNRKDKKAFSIEFIEDHDEGELDKRIHESVVDKTWQIYSNSPLPESVKRELEKVLG